MFSGPIKHFPVVIVNHILKDVLTTYLQEEQYEPELCRQMTKTISEVYVWFPDICWKYNLLILMKAINLQ